MTATTVPQAATRAARLLVQTHRCVDCKSLDERPFNKADEVAGQDYRPRKPAGIVSGNTDRSFRCLRHTRAREKARKARNRAAHKARRFGLSAKLQLILWAFQGYACPCGRKKSPVVPPGVTLDHDHRAPCVVRGDHPEDEGCPECVTGFVCAHCNTDIIGRLEGAFRKERDPRAAVAASFAGLHAHITDPPMRRLVAARPELLEEAA